MTKSKSDKENPAASVENTSGGGHVGGTYFGQEPDARTSSTTNKKGDKARPNNGKR